MHNWWLHWAENEQLVDKNSWQHGEEQQREQKLNIRDSKNSP